MLTYKIKYRENNTKKDFLTKILLKGFVEAYAINQTVIFYLLSF